MKTVFTPMSPNGNLSDDLESDTPEAAWTKLQAEQKSSEGALRTDGWDVVKRFVRSHFPEDPTPKPKMVVKK